MAKVKKSQGQFLRYRSSGGGSGGKKIVRIPPGNLFIHLRPV